MYSCFVVLTGCDYVSSCFRITKSRFLECFVHNADYICGSERSHVNIDTGMTSVF